MAPLVRNGGSRHTGQAAPPQRNIQKLVRLQTALFLTTPNIIEKLLEIKWWDWDKSFIKNNIGIFSVTDFTISFLDEINGRYIEYIKSKGDA